MDSTEPSGSLSTFIFKFLGSSGSLVVPSKGTGSLPSREPRVLDFYKSQEMKDPNLACFFYLCEGHCP